MYKVTGAVFQFAINAKDGGKCWSCREEDTIDHVQCWSLPNDTAPHIKRSTVPAEELPDLRTSSDITWLAWKPYHDKGVKLNHIITWSVVNGGTQRLIAAALEEMSDTVNNADKELKPYPWVGWRAGGQRGSLILGGIE